MCQLEWERVPPGEVKSFGGIVMIRVESLASVGGWNPAVIAAEDDELAIRLRRLGENPEARQTDGLSRCGITRFGQWWRRAVRWGTPMRRSRRSMVPAASVTSFTSGGERCFGDALVPLTSALGLLPTLGSSLWFLSAYPLQIVRLFVTRARER